MRKNTLSLLNEEQYYMLPNVVFLGKPCLKARKNSTERMFKSLIMGIYTIDYFENLVLNNTLKMKKK